MLLLSSFLMVSVARCGGGETTSTGGADPASPGVAVGGAAAPSARHAIPPASSTVAMVDPARQREIDLYVRSILEHRTGRDQFFGGPKSPAPAKQRGAKPSMLLEYYPVDPSWRLNLPFVKYPSPELLALITSTGEKRSVRRLGQIEFDRDGTRVRLQVYRAVDAEGAEESLWIPFIDAGSGSETYPAGRYVDAELLPGGSVLVDFNTAYNPYCAYGWDSYSCPITPRENRAVIPIRAGEKGFHR